MRIRIVLLLLLLHLNLACTNDYAGQYPYALPVSQNDGLQVDSLATVGMNKNVIRQAVGRIHEGKFGEIHSMLIYKDDRLVFEDYFEGHTYQWDAPGHSGNWVQWNDSLPHCIHSDTKSFVSLCIGIAIDKGFIQSVENSMFDYLPEYEAYNNGGKEKITIEHLLTMTSGLQWEEWDISLGSIENDQIAIWFYEGGPLVYILQKPVEATPGTRFNYSGGDIQLLAEILHNATGMNLDEFSQKYLFEPMGIQSNDWWLKFPSGGQIQAAGGLKLTPRDMAKIGAMMLNNGVWDGNRIVSTNWVEKCKTPFPGNTGIKIPGEDIGRIGYGYTWWTKKFKHRGETVTYYTALGWGGQKISILPELNLVVVFTGANYQSKVHNFKILERYILKSIME